MIKKIIKSIFHFINFVFQKIKFFLIKFFKILKRGFSGFISLIRPFFASINKSFAGSDFFSQLKKGIIGIGRGAKNLAKKTITGLVFWEKTAISVLLLIILICSSILGYRFYSNKTKLIPLTGGEYAEGMVGEPKYINPVLSQTNKIDAAICSLVFSGLTKFNQQREIVPDLAEKWTISPDGKTYTFYLRKNITWHDGKPLTADDILYTIAVVNDPDYQGALGKTWKDVKVEKINDNTVKITLADFCAGFLNNTIIGILPKHILSGIPAKNLSLHTFNLDPIGSGPYKFEKLQLNSFGGMNAVILTRNNNYYLSKPYLDKITLNFYVDKTSLFEAYKNKEIMGIDNISPDDAKTVGRWRNLSLYRTPLPEYTAFFLNNKKDLLDNKDIRQSLSYATNKKEIINKALYGEAQQVDGPILPSFFGYNPDAPKYKFDLAKAKSILEKDGFKEDKDGIRKKGNKKLEFSLVTNNSEANKKTAELIRDQWKKIGVGIKITTTDASTLQRDYIRPRNYDILFFGESLGADSDVFPYWHSSEINDPGLNLSRYVNKEADRCLEEGRKTGDLNSRKKRYIDFQNIIAEDAPAIFLYSPNYIYGVSSKIKGIDLGYIISPADRFDNANQWFVNYKRESK